MVVSESNYMKNLMYWKNKRKEKKTKYNNAITIFHKHGYPYHSKSIFVRSSHPTFYNQ